MKLNLMFYQKVNQFFSKSFRPMMFFLVFYVFWNAFENCIVQPLRGWGLLRTLFPLVAPGAIHI